MCEKRARFIALLVLCASVAMIAVIPQPRTAAYRPTGIDVMVPTLFYPDNVELMPSTGRHPACGEVHFGKDTIGSNLTNGHGMFIGVDGLFITAYHVLDMGFDVVKHVWVKFDGIDPIRAEYISGDFDDDIALMRLESVPEGIKPVGIAKSNPRPGDQLFLQAARHRDNCFVPFLCDPLTSSKQVCGNMHCWQGESGTGILNMAGELVGILTGGWQVCKDSAGKPIQRRPDGPDGPLTNKVYPTMSRSTPLEIWDLVNKYAASRDNTPATSDGIIKTYTGNLKDFQGGNVLVVISASWCQPCQKLKANLKAWESELAAAGIDSIVIVDADKYKAVADWVKPSVYPTVGKVIDGKLRSKWSGAPSKKQLKGAFDGN